MTKPKGSLISYMANRVKTEGGINLAQGIPAFDPPKELTDKLKNLADLPIHQYAPGIGNPLLLDVISQHYKANKQNLLIANGATECISLLFTYLSGILKGEFTTMAFSPAYESYKHLPRIFNKPYFAYPLNNAEIDFKHLEDTIKEKQVKIIFLASPGNPFGRIWSEKEINKLIALTEQNGAYLIFDAVYADLYFQSKPYTPAVQTSAHVFYVNALSKQLSITGWRIGYLFAHDTHMDKIKDTHDYIGLCTPSILQQAAAEYLQESNFGSEYSRELRVKLAANYQELATALATLGFKVFDASGGYFVWAELPEQFKNGLDFAIKLYEKHGVAVVPGIHFTDDGNTKIRFNIAQKPEVLGQAIEKIKTFILEN